MADRVPGGEGSRSCDSPESTPRSLVAALARDDNQLHSSGTEGVIPRSVPWPRDIGGTPESKSRSFALLRCSGRQKNKSSGGQRVVILRPGVWPKDLGLEGVSNQRQIPRPLRGCSAITSLARDDKQKGKGRSLFAPLIRDDKQLPLARDDNKRCLLGTKECCLSSRGRGHGRGISPLNSFTGFIVDCPGFCATMQYKERRGNHGYT